MHANAQPAPLPWAAPETLAFADETPVDPLDAAALMCTLPLRGDRLAQGKPFTILAIGDSVTSTGPYPEILARLLSRATDNKNISIARAAYPGKSVDTAVRRSARDIDTKPCDLALIMFGLNDQGALTPVEAYLEQTEWLINRLRAHGADVILLEPTPHINITPLPADKNPPPPEAAIFRVITFAGALRLLAEKTHTPIAPTFDAIWNAGAAGTLQQTARNLWPYFPQHYQKPFTNIADTNGVGDTIHPNARGHLLLARAVFDTIARIPQPAEPLLITGETFWKTGTTSPEPTATLATRLALTNTSSLAITGTLAAYPFPHDNTHTTFTYALRSGETATHTIAWPGITKPADLLTHPSMHVFAGPSPILQIVDYTNNTSRVRAVPVPLTPRAHFIRERTISQNNTATARIRDADGTITKITISIPPDSPAGRIPLSQTITHAHAAVNANRGIPLAAELAYVRYAPAHTGEATLDGDLADWPALVNNDAWFPVGEPVQARWMRGPADYRKTPAECYTRWAIKAGADGIWFAFHATGDIGKDTFTIYFDPRLPAELGTAGPYSWIDGVIKSDGQIALKPGDSFLNTGAKLAAKYKTIFASTSPSSPASALTTAEIFVPYDVLGIARWPASGDLGLSIIWTHKHETTPPTRLMWSDNGHPWNTRWFGVARRDPDAPLPCMIRIQ